MSVTVEQMMFGVTFARQDAATTTKSPQKRADAPNEQQSFVAVTKTITIHVDRVNLILLGRMRLINLITNGVDASTNGSGVQASKTK